LKIKISDNQGKKFVKMETEQIVFPTKHSAAEFTSWLIKNKVLKKCSNFEISRSVAAFSNKVTFYFECREDSLEARDSSSGMDFYGCPPNCHYFIDPKKIAVKNILKDIILFIPRLIRFFLKWYSTANWVIQVVLIFLLILSLAPKWVSPLIKLIEAIKK